MSKALFPICHLLTLLLASPLLPGLIAKTKAWVAGRSGPPLLQPYFDIARLLQKGAVYSETTTWLFRAGPVAAFGTALAAGMMVPFLGPDAPISFAGDALAVAALFGLGRFFSMAAAMDVGSSFEGMGASREATFSALVEPAIFLIFAILCIASGSFTVSGAVGVHGWYGDAAANSAAAAAAVALFIALLAENGRIPVDDPATHLELTMIHEVMELDHSGPDLAFYHCAASVKLFVFSVLLVRLALPMPDSALAQTALTLAGCMATAVAVGAVEASMARLRMRRVPQFLLGAAVVALVGVLVMAR